MRADDNVCTGGGGLKKEKKSGQFWYYHLDRGGSVLEKNGLQLIGYGSDD